jgi:hypothetical protein
MYDDGGEEVTRIYAIKVSSYYRNSFIAIAQITNGMNEYDIAGL